MVGVEVLESDHSQQRCPAEGTESRHPILEIALPMHRSVRGGVGDMKLSSEKPDVADQLLDLARLVLPRYVSASGRRHRCSFCLFSP
jgi:hypothetical protein